MREFLAGFGYKPLSADEAADVSMIVKVVCGMRLAILATLVCFPSARLYHDPTISPRWPVIVLASVVGAVFSVILLARWNQFGPRIAASWWWPVVEVAAIGALFVTYGVGTPVGPFVASTTLLAATIGGRRVIVVGGAAVITVTVVVVSGVMPLFNNGIPGISFRAISMAFYAVAYLVAGVYIRRLLIGQGQATRLWIAAQSREAVAQEQIRVSEDVRDKLSKGLDDARAMADVLVRSLDDHANLRVAVLVRQLSDGLRTATEEAATLSQGLRNNGPTDIVPACQQAIAAFARHAPAVTVETTGLDTEMKVAADVYHEVVRTLSELLENVRRHSRATAVRVTVADTTTRVFLRVADNGIGLSEGFDLSEFERAGHFGLVGIQDRVRRVGGSFTLESGRGGTAVTLAFPAGTETTETTAGNKGREL